VGGMYYSNKENIDTSARVYLLEKS
jgi:hypothetical protein